MTNTIMKETILYVDDEEINLELFKATFEEEYNVLTADSGIKGLEMIKERKDINIIVSDVKMPEMNGFEFIKRVKLMAPKKVCIVLSAFLKSDFAEGSVNDKDIYRYLNKPWRRPEMNQVLLEAIDNYRSLKEA